MGGIRNCPACNGSGKKFGTSITPCPKCYGDGRKCNPEDIGELITEIKKKLLDK